MTTNIQNEIRIIQRSDLPQEEKMKKIRDLMNKNNQKYSSKTKEEKKLKPCTHYNNNCNIFCSLCNSFYSCRLCHDQVADHKIDRYTINKVVCKLCKTIQAPGHNCIKCRSLFGKYYCKICNLWENDNKEIFHCDKCKICRVGRREDYVHCDKCNLCIAVDHYNKGHKCIENSTKTNCPVCNEFMFDSYRQAITILKCGHTLHEECFRGLIENKEYRCPICKKSSIDMRENWKAKDQMASLELIPQFYMKKRLIIYCNDCDKKSDIKFSFDFKKCSECGSYNTNEIESYDDH